MSAEAEADDGNIQIRDVWCDNLEEEFARICDIVDDYPFVAMDTEFPGVVLQSIETLKNIADAEYHKLKINVDALKLIQLGLTFSDARGNLPTSASGHHCVWQFNFREFDLEMDAYAGDSMNLLRESGHDFKKNTEIGVDSRRFGELLMSSGVVLNDSVRWIAFHGNYDFGYLLKLLTGSALPENRYGFFKLLKVFFPIVYDVKHLIKFCGDLHGGLNKVARLLGIRRFGVSHQAGSDSLLTSRIFTRLNQLFFNSSPEMYSGVVHGIDFQLEVRKP